MECVAVAMLERSGMEGSGAKVDDSGRQERGKGVEVAIGGI